MVFEQGYSRANPEHRGKSDFFNLVIFCCSFTLPERGRRSSSDANSSHVVPTENVLYNFPRFNISFPATFNVIPLIQSFDADATSRQTSSH